MRRDQLHGSFFGPNTLVDLLQHRARFQAEQTAYTWLVDGESAEQHLTYAQLDRQVRAIAAALERLELAGERALLLFPPGLEFISAFFACSYAGVVAVPAYPPRANRSLSRIQAIAADAEAKVALTVSAVMKRVQPLLPQTPDLERIKWLSTDEIPVEAAEDWSYPFGVTSETLAFLQYTSGSTGTPKGVMLTHANLMHNSGVIAHSFEHTRSGKGIFWLPSYHDMGLIGGILQPLYVARPNVLMSPMAFLQKPIRWLAAISNHRGTTSGGPNFAYDLCLRKITPEQRATLDLSSWSVAFNGAEPVRAETVERFTEMFGPCGFKREAFYPCFGLAEATLIVSGGMKHDPPILASFDSRALEAGRVEMVSLPDIDSRQLVGCGECLPDQEIEIVDPETHTRVPPGRVGEVWVKGPSIAQGYWRRPELTEQVFRATLADTGDGPFMRTGDLGFLVDRELYVTGRLKDLIIIRGLNHYPQDIELSVEKSHPALRPDCGAVFTVERDGREALVVVQEVERRQEAEADQIFEAVRREVSRDHELVVDAIVLIKAGSMPKTSSGKIQRHAARAEFLAGTLEVVADWEASTADEPFAFDLDAAPRSQPGFAPPEKSNGSQDAPVAASSHPSATLSPSRPAPGKVRVAEQLTTAETVLRIMRRVAGERAANLTLASTLADLGLDSLEKLEIVNALEEHFGGRFPEDVPGGLETVQSVVDAVDEHLAGRSGGTPAGAPEEIPAENYCFDRFPEYLKLRQSLDLVQSAGLVNPFFKVHEGLSIDTTWISGREYINFSSFNYLGMSGDPVVGQAAKEAIDRYGTSASASRLVAGEKTIHRELERAVADFVGTEDSIAFVGGHSANESTIGHLFGKGDLVIHDALAHNSIVQGCMLSGAARRAFLHNDWHALDSMLADIRSQYRRVLIAIEGIYSMDGDFPDLPRFIEVKKRHKAFLYIDEAHSVGVMGPHGRGIGEHFDVDTRDVDVWMGTLSKAFGSTGGYVAGSKPLIEYLRYTAPAFVFSVGMAPASAAAALAALRILESEPERVATLADRSALFLRLAKERGFHTGHSKGTPVIPVIIGSSLHALALSESMAKRGVNVQPIVYPAVEERAARLRFFINARHTPEQIQYTVSALADEAARLDPRLMGGGEPAQASMPEMETAGQA